MAAAAVAVRSVILRAPFFWIVLRCFVLAGAAALGERPPGALTPMPFLAVVVPAIVIADARAMRELPFLANLGVGARHIAGAAFLLIAGLELACTLLFAS